MNPIFVNTIVIWERNLEWQKDRQQSRRRMPSATHVNNSEITNPESDQAAENRKDKNRTGNSRHHGRSCETLPC